MKKISVVIRSYRLYASLSIFLSLLMVLILLPGGSLAKNVQGDSATTVFTQNRTLDISPPPTNPTLTGIVSGNTTASPSPELPSVSTLVPVTNIGANSATIRGSLSSLGSAEAVQVGFTYGTITSNNTATPLHNMLVSGNFSYVLQGLNPNTLYFYSATAVSSVGPVTGNTSSFSTLASPSDTPTPPPPQTPTPTPTANPTPTPTTTPTATPTPTVTPSPSPIPTSTPTPTPKPILPVVITGNATVDSVSNSFVLLGSLTSLGSYASARINFDYGKSGNYTSSTETIIMTSPGPFRINLLDYDINTSYHFRAKATSPGGISPGQDATFVSPSTLLKPIPQNPIPNPVPVSSNATLPVSNKVSIQVKPDQDSEIKSISGNITLKIPKGAVAAETNIELTENGVNWGSPGMQIVKQFDLNATDQVSQAAVSQFNKNLGISIQNNDFELAGLDAQSLHLYYLDEKTKSWVPLADSQYDKDKKVLTASTTHFSHYGEMANPLFNGPGRVMAANTDLHSGTATFSYPLELPPGPGGFQPKVELTYSSASVNEMKNLRSVGSWVGIGWDLNLGHITFDPVTRAYYLDLSGGSYQLYATDNNGVTYHTNPDQHYKLNHNMPGDWWEMWDKDGTYYRFGYYTNSSKQYLENSLYYRWDLDLIRDTNNNQATIDYVQDVRSDPNGSWVCSAYPTALKYNNNLIEVDFNSTFDITNDATDGNLRYDDPRSAKDQGGTIINPAPKMMDNKHLDSILIKVNGNPIRQYNLAYNNTSVSQPNPAYQISQYGTIYYAGELKLLSITQKGADLNSSLPAMSFDYDTQDLQIYRNDSNSQQYVGNPGNPTGTNLHWPYLKTINSGYGGSTVYSYTQKPNTSATNIWTREVVTTKTIHPGVGLQDQTTNYSYQDDTLGNDNPQYLGTGWDQKFRGFGQVRETDGASNYAIHYYYTTGTINSQDAEKLTGREYKTKWYQHGTPDVLLREVDNSWSFTYTSQIPDYTNYSTLSWNVLKSLALSPAGNLYAADINYNRIVEFYASGGYTTFSYTYPYYPPLS